MNPGISDEFSIFQAGRYLMKVLRRKLRKGRLLTRPLECYSTTNWLRACSGCGALFVLLILSSCKSIGPNVVLKSHVKYNKAIEQVIREELLLNIVRRRYYEAPQFVTVSSITTSMNTSAGISGGSAFGNQGIPTTGNVGGSLNWSDSPTITITPRQGTEILGALTSRMSVNTLGKMANAGYRFDFLLSLTAEGLTSVRGPQTGVGTDFRPGDPEYLQLIESIGRLIDRGQLNVGTFSWNDPYSDISYSRKQITVENQLTAIALGGGTGRFRSYDGGKSYYFTDKNNYPAMWIDPDARTSGDGRRVINLLNLQPTPLKRIWTFAPSRVVGGKDFENVPDDPRPEVKDADALLLLGAEPACLRHRNPPGGREEGRAFTKASYDQAVREGRAVDISDKFVVYSSRKRPENAFVAVKHRGRWFYVDDRDYRSKRFFNGVYDIFNMEIAPSGGGGGPILTLPVK
jgi:hypothetical protein